MTIELTPEQAAWLDGACPAFVATHWIGRALTGRTFYVLGGRGHGR